MSDPRRELISRMTAFVDRAEQRRKLEEEDEADFAYFERELGQMGAQPLIAYLSDPNSAPEASTDDEPYTDQP